MVDVKLVVVMTASSKTKTSFLFKTKTNWEPRLLNQKQGHSFAKAKNEKYFCMYGYLVNDY